MQCSAQYIIKLTQLISKDLIEESFLLYWNSLFKSYNSSRNAKKLSHSTPQLALPKQPMQ